MLNMLISDSIVVTMCGFLTLYQSIHEHRQTYLALRYVVNLSMTGEV